MRRESRSLFFCIVEIANCIVKDAKKAKSKFFIEKIMDFIWSFEDKALLLLMLNNKMSY